MMRLILFIATGAGMGYLPKVPGTWGTLVALPLQWLMMRLSPQAHALALLLVLVVGWFTAGAAEKIFDRKDPGVIVIDEILGMLITLVAVPARPLPWLIAFLLFRFFDIVKPWPVCWADRHLNGGLGIMLDDVLAGGYAWLTLQGMLLLFPRLVSG